MHCLSYQKHLEQGHASSSGGLAAWHACARSCAIIRPARIYGYSRSWRRAKLFAEPANPAAVDGTVVSARRVADDDGLYTHYYRAVTASASARYSVFSSKSGAGWACAFSHFFRHGARVRQGLPGSLPAL